MTSLRTLLRCVAVVGAVALGATAESRAAFAQEFHVDLEADRSVVFVSTTSVNEFEGRSDRIDGYALLAGDGVRAAEDLEGSELYFEVDLASLRTGIRLRDRHMRNNYLEVDDFPYAAFQGSLDWIRPRSEGGFTIQASGTFEVHGVTRDRTMECSVVPDGDGFRVECDFPVTLSDHDIEIPRVMFLELAPEVRLQLSFRLIPAR